MDFETLEQQYQVLRRQRDAGQITPQAFTAAVQQLRLNDASGAWWTINEVDGSWLHWDGAAWQPAVPPRPIPPPPVVPPPAAVQPFTPVAGPVTPQAQPVTAPPAGLQKPRSFDPYADFPGGPPKAKAKKEKPVRVQPAAQPTAEPEPPQNVGQLFTRPLGQFFRNLPRRWWIYLVGLGGLAVGVWIFHIYLMVGPNEGFYVKARHPILGEVLNAPGGGGGILFWLLAGILLGTVVIRLFTRGVGPFFKQLSGMVPFVRASIQASGRRGLAAACFGAAFALLVALILRNFMASLVLFLLTLIALLMQQRSLPALIMRFVFPKLSRGASLNPAFIGMIVGGMTIGFLLGVIPWWIAWLIFLILALGGGVALLLLKPGSVKLGRGMAILLMGLMLFSLTTPVLADEGGWQEAGGTFDSWWNSDYADPAIEMGILPGLFAAFGALLGIIFSNIPGLDKLEDLPWAAAAEEAPQSAVEGQPAPAVEYQSVLVQPMVAPVLETPLIVQPVQPVPEVQAEPAAKEPSVVEPVLETPPAVAEPVVEQPAVIEPAVEVPPVAPPASVEPVVTPPPEIKPPVVPPALSGMETVVAASSLIGWKLTILTGELTGKEFRLEGRATLGRSEQNNILLPDGRASRVHAALDPMASGYFLTDLNSTNGTLLNDQMLPPMQPAALKNGDVITIGDTRLRVDVPPAVSLQDQPTVYEPRH